MFFLEFSTSPSGSYEKYGSSLKWMASGQSERIQRVETWRSFWMKVDGSKGWNWTNYLPDSWLRYGLESTSRPRATSVLNEECSFFRVGEKSIEFERDDCDDPVGLNPESGREWDGECSKLSRFKLETELAKFDVPSPHGEDIFLHGLWSLSDFVLRWNITVRKLTKLPITRLHAVKLCCQRMGNSQLIRLCWTSLFEISLWFARIWSFGGQNGHISAIHWFISNRLVQ